MQPKGTDKEKGLLEYLASLILGDNDPKFSLNKFKKDCDILNEKRIDKIGIEYQFIDKNDYLILGLPCYVPQGADQFGRYKDDSY